MAHQISSHPPRDIENQFSPIAEYFKIDTDKIRRKVHMLSSRYWFEASKSAMDEKSNVRKAQIFTIPHDRFHIFKVRDATHRTLEYPLRLSLGSYQVLLGELQKRGVDTSHERHRYIPSWDLLPTAPVEVTDLQPGLQHAVPESPIELGEDSKQQSIHCQSQYKPQVKHDAFRQFAESDSLEILLPSQQLFKPKNEMT